MLDQEFIGRVAYNAYNKGDVKTFTSNLYENGDSPIINPYAIDAEDVINIVLKSVPTLCYLGLEPGYEDYDARAEPFLKNSDGFLVSVNWIRRNLKHARYMNTQTHSNLLNELFERDVGVYVSNGMFICAMLAEMYKCRKTCGTSVIFDTKQHYINKIEKRIH